MRDSLLQRSQRERFITIEVSQREILYDRGLTKRDPSLLRSHRERFITIEVSHREIL